VVERLDLFAACAPGLESLLAAELEALGIEGAAPEPGGVAFRGELADVYRVNLGSGIALRVLLRIGSFRCARLPELRRKAGNVEWGRWLDPSVPCTVQARSRKSKLYHSGAIEERVAAAIEEFGCAAGEGVGVHVRFDHNECTLSIDTSGELLHRRGWRLETAKAPLREDIAHAVLRASGWDREIALVDPFTGAGTLAIEAAAMARGLAPGRLRGFAFERLADFDGALWRTVQDEAAARARSRAPGPIAASDRDRGAVAAVRANAERAGVLADLTVAQAPLSSAPMLGDAERAPTRGIVVCNPPHGRRIGDPKALRDLYSKLGRMIPAGWTLALVASDLRLARHTGRPLETAFSVEHGGARIHILVG